MNIFKRLFKVIKREHRFEINRFHSIEVCINKKKYAVKNLSLDGIGIVVPESFNDGKVGEKIAAEVKFHNITCQVALDIVQLNGKTLGAKVLELTNEYSEMLKAFFEAEVLGLSFKRVEAKNLKKSEIGKAQWFYGDDEHELYLVTDRADTAELLYFQLTYKNYVFEYNEEKVLSINTQISDNRSQRHKGSHLLEKNSDKLSKDIFSHALRVIEVIPELDATLKDKIKDILYQKFKAYWIG